MMPRYRKRHFWLFLGHSHLCPRSGVIHFFSTF